jgi:hypothetical protein
MTRFAGEFVGPAIGSVVESALAKVTTSLAPSQPSVDSLSREALLASNVEVLFFFNIPPSNPPQKETY